MEEGGLTFEDFRSALASGIVAQEEAPEVDASPAWAKQLRRRSLSGECGFRFFCSRA